MMFMNARNLLRLLVPAAILAAGSLVHAATGDQILGTWSPDNGRESKIEITKCGDRYCGAIIWMRLASSLFIEFFAAA